MATNPGKPMSTKAIAQSFDVSEAHLSKVLQRLGKVGLLKSARGPRGGFTLARSPKEITLLDVFEAIEGSLNPDDCLFGTPMCDGESCVLGTVLVQVNSLLRNHLEGTSLLDASKVFKGERFQII